MAIAGFEMCRKNWLVESPLSRLRERLERPGVSHVKLNQSKLK
jgi:hypothetical protein